MNRASLRRLSLMLVLGPLACGCATPPAPPGATPSAPGSPPSTREAFYSQRADYGQIPVMAHRAVSAEGIHAARERLELLLRDAPRLRRNLVSGKFELHVLGVTQFPSELPEYRQKRGSLLDNGQLFDWHMIGGHLSEGAAHYSSCTEATLLPIVGHRLFGDEPCIHELAHAVDWFALDATVRARVAVEFRESTGSGRWRGKYAATNEHEWFAEVTKFYFRADRADLAFYDPNLALGRRWLCDYDRRACDFVAALYSDRIDPGTPTSTVLAPQPGSLEGSLRSREGRIPARLVVRNRTAQRIHLVWLDYEGKRDARQPFARQTSASPGEEVALSSWATHAFVVTDDAEKALCTTVVPEEEAIVDVSGACP